jgi:hypothetical protein
MAHGGSCKVNRCVLIVCVTRRYYRIRDFGLAGATMKLLLFLTALLVVPVQAGAQRQALKSFAYTSSGCTLVDGAAVLTFGNGQWKMGPGNAPPGAGVFPAKDFYIRAISVSYLGSAELSAWVEIGKFNGESDDSWLSPLTMTGKTTSLTFPADAAPIFQMANRPYLDAHVDRCSSNIVWFAIWWAPALRH